MKKYLSLLVVLFTTALLLPSCNSYKVPKTATTVKAPKSKPYQEGRLKIEYIAHASFLLTYDGTTLLLDPYADTTWLSYYFPRDIKADAVVSTHPHYDHDGGIFRDLKPYWQGTMPFYQDPGHYQIGDFKVTGIKGKHCDPYGKEFGQKNTVFIFDVAGIRLAHWGDNETINDDMAAQLSDVDILMVPIDDTYHILKAHELADLIRRINPKVIIPMHYRINELEPTAGIPKNLGPIDAYFANRKNVRRIAGNVWNVGKSELPRQQEYVILRHSSSVVGI